MKRYNFLYPTSSDELMHLYLQTRTSSEIWWHTVYYRDVNTQIVVSTILVEVETQLKLPYHFQKNKYIAKATGHLIERCDLRPYYQFVES